SVCAATFSRRGTWTGWTTPARTWKPWKRRNLSISTDAYAGNLNPPGRPARGWLVGLLVFTLVFTAVLLFAKYRYDGLRDSLRAQAQAQLDRYFASESISIEGSRGVRI